MSKDSRKDSDKDRHMPILEHGADTLQRVEIITGTGRRRGWSTDAKAAIVAESFAPGASVSAVARRHDISPSLLFLWRRQAPRAHVAERGDRGMPPGLCRSRSPAVGARVRSRRRSRSRSARFASVSGGQSTGRHCARCWQRSGRLVGLVDDRASSWVVDLDCDAAGRFPPRHGLAGDAGERGLWSRSVRRRTLCLPLQTPRSREDPDLGWKRPCPLLQKNRGAVHLAADQGRRHVAISCSALGAARWLGLEACADANCGSAGTSWLIIIKSRSSLTRSCCRITLHE